VSDPYKIPILDLQAQHRTIHTEVRAAIDEVIASQEFILGPAVARFETAMAQYLGVPHAVGVASGSDALLLALMALEIGPGDAVMVPPFTFFSTVSAIIRLGGKPLFIDIDEENYLLSPKALRRLLAERVDRKNGKTIDRKSGARIKALLPVHLFGQCCAMEQIAPLAQEFGLRIVEDVAQGCGARMMLGGKEHFAGALGDVGCFSFFPSKTLGAYGDGGLITCREEELGRRLHILRMHGETEKYHHTFVGINSRLDAIQAAILTVKQRHLDRWCDQRIERARTYYSLFAAADLLGPQRVLAAPAPAPDKTHVFNNYVIRAARRDALRAFLQSRGIQTEIYYPVPLHLQRCFSQLGHVEGDFPKSELAARQVLALPLYPELTIAQQESVVSAIGDFFQR
jgi:dTDP-4-amino-4,6-dideoxygalactose transaminase